MIISSMDNQWENRILKIDRFSFLVLSAKEAINLELNRPYVLISVNEPGSDEIIFKTDKNRLDILKLRFHDSINRDNADSRMMSNNDAHQIVDFALEYANSDVVYVVHCTMGVSRSPAIAAGIAGIHGCDIRPFWLKFMPNSHVFGTIMTCHAIKLINLAKQAGRVL